jgi:hypothetical protein
VRTGFQVWRKASSVAFVLKDWLWIWGCVSVRGLWWWYGLRSSYFLAQAQPAVVCSLVRVPGSMARGKGSSVDGAAFRRFGGYVEDVWATEPWAVAP